MGKKKMPADPEAKFAAQRTEGEGIVLATFAAMPEPDRSIGEKIHSIVMANAPLLIPKLWYGMPAYANQDGKVVCFFQSAEKFKTRYATFGFQHEANLDEGGMWVTSFAVKEINAQDEQHLGELVRKAVRVG